MSKYVDLEFSSRSARYRKQKVAAWLEFREKDNLLGHMDTIYLSYRACNCRCLTCKLFKIKKCRQRLTPGAAFAVARRSTRTNHNSEPTTRGQHDCEDCEKLAKTSVFCPKTFFMGVMHVQMHGHDLHLLHCIDTAEYGTSGNFDENMLKAWMFSLLPELEMLASGGDSPSAEHWKPLLKRLADCPKSFERLSRRNLKRPIAAAKLTNMACWWVDIKGGER